MRHVIDKTSFLHSESILLHYKHTILGAHCFFPLPHTLLFSYQILHIKKIKNDFNSTNGIKDINGITTANCSIVNKREMSLFLFLFFA